MPHRTPQHRHHLGRCHNDRYQQRGSGFEWLQDWGLSAGLATQAYGIYAAQRQNITIKNGTVRGFFYGIYLNDNPPFTTSQGHVIEDIRADQNTYVGLYIKGKGNTIRNDLVVATGGTTISANAYSYGIFILGPGAQVLNNTVLDVTAKGTNNGYGIYLSTSNSVVESKRISTVTAPSGSAFGIYLASGSDILVSDNRISGTIQGIYFNAAAGATGTYMNNLVRSSGAFYTGGSAAGTTNH